MNDFVGGCFTIGLLVLSFMLGEAFGHDRLRLDIINACIERNPDMANSKVRPYCQEQYDDLLIKKKD